MATRNELENVLKRLHLVGCLAHLDELDGEEWLDRLVTLETEERTRRTLENRTRIAGLGSYKPLCDFDWAWPKKIDRGLVEELLTLRFMSRLHSSNEPLYSSRQFSLRYTITFMRRLTCNLLLMRKSAWMPSFPPAPISWKPPPTKYGSGSKPSIADSRSATVPA